MSNVTFFKNIILACVKKRLIVLNVSWKTTDNEMSRAEQYAKQAVVMVAVWRCQQVS